MSKITRRDFLNGTQVALGASLLSPWTRAFGTLPAAFELPAGYYPPGETGLRGSHDGSWEVMHGVAGGKRWSAGAADEKYDLVVVGGGISGLSAAYFYLQKKPDARILVLDNHDDFGGHAKRNEFMIDDRVRIGYGGTESIDTPSAYPEAARTLLQDLGIRLDVFYEAFDASVYTKLGLSKGILFDDKSFTARRLVVGYGSRPWEEFAAEAPLTDAARRDFVRLQTSQRDYLPNLPPAEKSELLHRTSYEVFLRDMARVDPQVIEIYRRWGMSFWCVGIDEIPASSVLSYDGMPGLEHTLPREGNRGDDPYIFHFPDGNATVARLLVRALIPEALPGNTQEDSIRARLDYGKLDRAGQRVRIRLNSTAVQAVHTPDGREVDVVFVRAGKAHAVRARDCIMACYNSAIPYLCPELPEAQKNGLAYGTKVPLTYVKVCVPNWRPFAELGLDYVYYTNDFYKQVELDFPVSIGGYSAASSPDDPMILHMCYVPFLPDIQGPAQWQAAREIMLGMEFSTFESHVRDQLDQALGSAGFDAARDIHAITVNRWPHGYAYDPHMLWEPEWASEAEKPWVIGRQPLGRIKIANSDAAAAASTDPAIMEAWRAVAEIGLS
jgi:spermidine dehydrogenase